MEKTTCTALPFRDFMVSDMILWIGCIVQAMEMFSFFFEKEMRANSLVPWSLFLSLWDNVSNGSRSQIADLFPSLGRATQDSSFTHNLPIS
jgi:hypothetical protein